MKNASLIYQSNNGTFNLGDYIQSLAAMQYFNEIDEYINREELGKYNKDPAKIILNGWFTHKPETWVPSDKLLPLFVSFHINEFAKEKMLSQQGKEYLLKHQPIGCRDYATVEILKAEGIDAYFSGCLTLTLGRRYKATEPVNRQGIYIVDPLFTYPIASDFFKNLQGLKKYIKYGTIFKVNYRKSILEKCFHKDILNQAKYITHDIVDNNMPEKDKFMLAKQTLNTYSTAKLVITSRIHVALPCLAMNTPVIFIDKFNTIGDTCRFNGITDLFNVIKVDKNGKCTYNFPISGKISSNDNIANPTLYENLVDPLVQKCIAFSKK